MVFLYDIPKNEQHSRVKRRRGCQISVTSQVSVHFLSGVTANCRWSSGHTAYENGILWVALPRLSSYAAANQKMLTD